MTRLASTCRCWVPAEKLRTYLLDLGHHHGGPKARFFRSVGFTLENMDGFARALEQHAGENEIEAILPSPHGTKYRVRCHIRTPDGRDPCVISIWIDDKDRGEARLVTAYPR